MANSEWNKPPIDLEAVIDIPALEQGDVIGYDLLSQLVDETPGSSLWNAKATGVAQKIQSILWEAGKTWTLRVMSNKIVILTDEGAAKFNLRAYRNNARRLAKNHKQTCGIDQSKLDETDKKKVDRALRIQGAELAALLAVRRSIKPVATERTIPRLPGTVSEA